MWDNWKSYRYISLDIILGKAKLKHHPSVRQFLTITEATKFGIKFGKGQQKINMKIYRQANLHTLNLVPDEVNNVYLVSTKSAVEPTSRILTIFLNSYSSAGSSEKNECVTATSIKHPHVLSSFRRLPLSPTKRFLQWKLLYCCHM
jgi:hypothetical protein